MAEETNSLRQTSDGLTQTVSVADFKKANKADKLQFNQYKDGKRHFAILPNGKRVFKAEKLRADEPLFISLGQYGVYWLHNDLPEAIDSFEL